MRWCLVCGTKWERSGKCRDGAIEDLPLNSLTPWSRDIGGEDDLVNGVCSEGKDVRVGKMEGSACAHRESVGVKMKESVGCMRKR